MRLGHRFAAMAHSFSDANAPFSQWATLSNPCLTRLVDSSSDNGSSPSSESVPSKKKARLNESELWTEESTLDPADWTSFGTQSHHMLDDALNYVQNIRERPVWQPIPDDTRSRFQTMLPRLSGSLEEVHGSFLRDILPYVVGNVHPGFMGWVHGGGNPVAMVADMLAAGLNANVGGRNQIPVEVERQVTRWMRELFQFPDTASGIFVTGTSMANLMSVHIARRHALGSTVRQSGLRESPRQLVAYTSTEAHGCISQAMDLSGIGSSFLRLIPCNDRYQIDTEALVATIAADRAAGFEPFMIIGTAGSVDVGAVDPLNQLADIASVEKLWFHVDGAYGALGVLSPILAPLFSGLERADSIAFDFHKWAQVQYDAGFLLVRDGTSHMETFAAPAAYLRREVRGLAGGSPWPCDFGPDLSRSFRALKTWFTFQVYGADKLGQIIQNTCDIAQYLVGKISAYKELELLAPVTLNIVCFRFIGGISVPMISNSALDSLNSEIVADLHESGTVAPSVTTIDSKLAIRVAIVNHRTNKQNIDLLIEKVLNLGSIRLEGISLVA